MKRLFLLPVLSSFTLLVASAQAAQLFTCSTSDGTYAIQIENPQENDLNLFNVGVTTVEGKRPVGVFTVQSKSTAHEHVFLPLDGSDDEFELKFYKRARFGTPFLEG